MAMAKPINSLQFIFLNHLSSHEKIFIKVTPSKCSACIRSLIVSTGLHWHCALIVIPTEWPPRIVAEGWEKFDHILYLPCCIQPQQRSHWSDTLMASPLTSDQVTPDASLLLSRASDVGWPGPGGHCLAGVYPRMATPHVLGVRSNNMWWEMFSKRQLA